MIDELSATADSDSDSRTFSGAAMAEESGETQARGIVACSTGRSLYSSSISRIPGLRVGIYFCRYRALK
jgi:hypothetical protein